MRALIRFAYRVVWYSLDSDFRVSLDTAYPIDLALLPRLMKMQSF